VGVKREHAAVFSSLTALPGRTIEMVQNQRWHHRCQCDYRCYRVTERFEQLYQYKNRSIHKLKI